MTELLTGERLETQALPPDTVEDLVKTAITYQEAGPSRAWSEGGPRKFFYLLGGLCQAVCLLMLYQKGQLTESVMTGSLLASIFGGYFCLFVQKKLPAYYDQNQISGVHDGIMRMDLPGLYFNNSNWPHIIKAGRMAMLANMVLLPLTALIVVYINYKFWLTIEAYITLVLLLGGLFIPLYLVGKKYE